MPEVVASPALSRMKMVFSIWRKPEDGGDAALLLPVGDAGVVVAVVDIAGHGTTVMPQTMHVQGWLRGRLGWLSGLPRLPELVGDLSAELGATGIDAAVFLALIRPLPGAGGGAEYEAVACGFPPPLLLHGYPERSVVSCARWPSLPASTSLLDPVSPLRLSPPWRLSIASDGLLARLGGGSETRGRKALRTWQTGPRRDRPPRDVLDTPTAAADDECYVSVRWDGWDSEVSLDGLNHAKRHELIRRVEASACSALGRERGFWYADAVVEAMHNATRHAYGNGSGVIRVRCRDEGACFRAEVEDRGAGRVSRATVANASGGFVTMRPHLDQIDVREGEDGGTIVTLVAKKENRP